MNARDLLKAIGEVLAQSTFEDVDLTNHGTKATGLSAGNEKTKA